MIVISKAVEPKVAKATSTYPAVVLMTDGRTSADSAFTNIKFFCPSTMSGQPSEAFYAPGNNTVEAPTKPHNGENVADYIYQKGDVIMISYADGDLNSPQFVRYVPITENVRNQNAMYIDGTKVSQGDIFDIGDSSITLDSPLLAKAVSLLKYIKIAAKGSENNKDIYGIWHGVGDLNSDLIYYKCGVYGVELLCRDVPEEMHPIDGLYIPLTGMYGGDIVSPDTTFLKIGQTFYSLSSIEQSTIVDVFIKAYKDAGLMGEIKLDKDTRSSLYLYQAFVGLDEWKRGAQLFNNRDYQANTEKPDGSASGVIKNYVDYLYHSEYTYIESYPTIPDFDLDGKVRQNFWNGYESYYSKEFDRVYAIILHNNVFNIQANYEIETVANLTLLILGIIASAWQTLEKTIQQGSGVFTDTGNEDQQKHKQFLDDIINNYLKKNVTKTELQEKADYIASGFADMHHYYLTCKFGWLGNKEDKTIIAVRDRAKNNIKSMISAVVANAEKILDVWGVDGTGQGDGITTGQFIWPVTLPGNYISSPFGWRILNGERNYHKGIDITGANFKGSTIVAADGGKVIKVVTVGAEGDWNGGYGKHVIIQHSNNMTTLYGHLNAVSVSLNDNVSRGQKIGEGGTTGASTGPHLHFEIRKNNVAENPLNYVNKP